MTLCTTFFFSTGGCRPHPPQDRKREEEGKELAFAARFCAVTASTDRTVVLCHIPRGSWFLVADQPPLALPCNLAPCSLHPYPVLRLPRYYPSIPPFHHSFFYSTFVSRFFPSIAAPLALVTQSQSGNASGFPGSKPGQSWACEKSPPSHTTHLSRRWHPIRHGCLLSGGTCNRNSPGFRPRRSLAPTGRETLVQASLFDL